MLQGIRDRSQGWIAWVIIGFVCVTFALWGIHNYFGSGGQDNTVAKVDGKSITESQFDRIYQRVMRQQAAQNGGQLPSNPDELDFIKQTVLKEMISTLVLSNAAFEQRYRIGQMQLDDAIESLPIFQENGKFSPQRFQEAIGALSYTEDAFMEEFRNIMLISQLRSAFADTAFMLPGEVDTAITLVNQKRDIGYLIVPPSRFESTVKVTDADIKNYYDQHQKDFMSPEQVSLQYVVLSANDIMKNIQISDAQSKQYYNDNFAMFTSPAEKEVAHILVAVPKDATPAQVTAAQDKINKIAQELQKDADFSQLALQNSDDKISAKKGGNIGWIAPGQLGPQFEQAVTGLNQMGQVTAPVRTQYGFDIIKLLAIKPSQVAPYDTVKSKIETILARQKAESVFADESDQLANLTYENPGSLTSAAKTLNLTVQTTPSFGREGLKQGFASNPKIVNAAFSENVLAQGNNSDPIQLDPSTLVVVRVLQHQLAAVMPLTQVQDKIKALLTQQAASKQAEQFGAQLLQQLQQGKSGEAVAKDNNLVWQSAKQVTRHAPSISPAILDTAFALPAPTAAQPISASGVLVGDDGSYAVIQVNNITAGTLADATKPMTRQEFQAQLEKAVGELDYGIYSLDQFSQAKINIEQKPTTQDPQQ